MRSLLLILLCVGCASSKIVTTNSIAPRKAILERSTASQNQFVRIGNCTEYVTNSVVAWTTCSTPSYGQCAITAYFNVPDNILTVEPDAGPPHSMMGKSCFENHVWTLQGSLTLNGQYQDLVSDTNNQSGETFHILNATLPTVFYRVRYQ